MKRTLDNGTHIESYDLRHGYTIVLVTMPDGKELASLGKDKKHLWLGPIETLRAAVASVERSRMN